MKYNILSVLAILTSTLVVNAQQTSLYDSQGEARAYIDFDEEATIFMWDGTPVAFLEKDGRDICVFGFNGTFMGWYEDGIIYDKKGYAVAAREGATNMSLRSERSKGSQRSTPSRPSTPSTPSQPSWKSSWSSTSLTEFLYFGKK
ncbi:MAG: 4-fold beta flower protein [Saprospiraceae bacterium]